MKIKDSVFALLPFKDAIGYHIAESHLSNPVFLVGCGRSGTTAMARALGEHRAIRAASNEGALVNLISGVSQHYFSDDYGEYVAESTALGDECIKANLVRLVYEVVWGRNYGLRGALSAYLRGIGRQGAGKWLVKVFPDEREYAGLVRLFPKSQFIYIYRNGMDVVNSMTRFGTFSKQPFEDLCEFWVDHMDRYGYLERGKSLVIRFEDFVESPQDVLSDCLDYLGLEEDVRTVDFAQSTVVHPLDQPDQNALAKDVIGSREAAYLAWTDVQREVFKRIAGQTMSNYGYSIDF